MHGMRSAVVLALAVVLLVGILGCDQTADATRAIAAANVQVKRYAQVSDELVGLRAQIASLPLDRRSARRAIALTRQMDAKIDAQSRAARAARTEFSRIKDMNVREGYKTYAEKGISLTNTLLEAAPIAEAIERNLLAIYSAGEQGRSAERDVTSLRRSIDAKTRQLSDLEQLAARKERIASDFFEAQKLAAIGQHY